MKRYLVREGTMTAIADAVRNKTGSSEQLSPAGMAEKIALIRTYEGDPVLEGVTITPTGTEIVKVPPHGVDGFGIVTVEGDQNLVPENIREGVTVYGVEGSMTDEGLDTSDATATPDDIMEGATAYVDGALITGTHVCPPEPILGSVDVTPTGSTFNVVPEEGIDGFSVVTVSGDDNLIPDNIKAGVTVYGVEGILTNDSSDATATEADIAESKTAYVNGVKLTGTHVCDASSIIVGTLTWASEEESEGGNG